MNITVFSKDRACQLDFFLQSMSIYFEEFYENTITVIYKTSNEQFADGYKKLMDRSKLLINVKFVEQTDFKEDVLRSINATEEHTVFFTDDDIWINHFSLAHNNFQHFKVNENILCFSLRLNTNLKYCYPTSSEIKALPQFGDYNVYAIAGTQGYYNYPMSVDGHIFRTKDILPLLLTLQYPNPNWLEYQMAVNPLKKPYMNCCNESVIMNNPCSVVQDVCKNRNENLDNNWINAQYLDNKILSFKMIKDIVVESCHQPIKLIFEEW